MADDRASAVYETRYGWGARTALTVGAALLFTVALLLLDVSMLIRVAGLALFGVGGLFMAYGALSRQTAFRVDETGVLLGGAPARYRATTAHVPWADITSVLTWRQKTFGTSVLWVGVVRREGAPPLPGNNRASAALKYAVPVPPEVVLSSRAVVGWHLDRNHLATAVAHYAPGTPLQDLS